MSNFDRNSGIKLLTEEERINQEFKAYSQITINGLSYDIVNGHFFIDGRYGYDESQRICEDDSNGKCLGVTN